VQVYCTNKQENKLRACIRVQKCLSMHRNVKGRLIRECASQGRDKEDYEQRGNYDVIGGEGSQP
jgi:hypothetical protein